jgi:hypothetical protein
MQEVEFPSNIWISYYHKTIQLQTMHGEILEHFGFDLKAAKKHFIGFKMCQ